jgi:transcriptional regulator CtsR
MEEYLEKVENKSKNFVFNRGAGGLRQITKVKKISETQLLKNCYKRVA